MKHICAKNAQILTQPHKMGHLKPHICAKNPNIQLFFCSTKYWHEISFSYYVWNLMFYCSTNCWWSPVLTLSYHSTVLQTVSDFLPIPYYTIVLQVWAGDHQQYVESTNCCWSAATLLSSRICCCEEWRGSLSSAGAAGIHNASRSPWVNTKF